MPPEHLANLARVGLLQGLIADVENLTQTA